MSKRDIDFRFVCKAVLLISLTTVALSGCSSISNTSCGGKVYGGVKGDVDGIQKEELLFKFVYALDLPFSLVADTFLLPVNINQQEKSYCGPL